MLRILTDTGSDITYLGASDAQVEIVELDVKFDEFPYDYRNDTDFSVFYSNLEKSKNLPSTSQVNPSQYLDIFNDVKEKGDEMLVVTLSGGLSGTYSSALMAQEECAYDGISIVDSKNGIVGQRLIVEQAIKLKNEGKNHKEIKDVLEAFREKVVLSACLDSLTYLKKGGRVPPAMALIGNALKIKPVILIKDGKVDPLDKVRGLAAGKRVLWDNFEKEGYDENYPIYFGHTNSEESGKAFMEETVEKFGIKNYKLFPVGAVIGTHAGPNCIVLLYVKK
ncbi:MAG: DegV family protein [Defluviitaleaceae bacterium]|nr:DegV family protein [Defluviitaleaceae bacterium]